MSLDGNRIRVVMPTPAHGNVVVEACVHGGNGAVYTQISDVEGELNGLLAYDREVLKSDVERVRAAHLALTRDASRVTPTGC
jgi:hypothetical protein